MRVLAACVFLAVFAAIPCAANAGNLYHSAYTVYTAPYQTFNAVVADLNGDSVPDLVVPVDGSVTVLIRLGIGDGTFAPPESLYTDYPNYESNVVVVADLDGDHKPDIVATLYNVVQVFLGHGDGTFDPPLRYGVYTGTYEHGLAVADVTGDGVLDVLCGQLGPLRIYPGVGDGSLGSPIDLPLGGTIADIQAADLDGDGDLDIGVLYSDTGGQYQLAIFPNQGASLGTPTLYPVSPGGAYFVGLQFVNLDADPALDALVGPQYLPGVGGGAFGTPVTVAAINEGPVGAADMNGDGAMDLLELEYYGAPFDQFEIQMGHGDGTFDPPVSSPTADYPVWVTPADFDRDGKLDAVVTTEVIGDLAIHHGNGDGTFGVRHEYSIGVGAQPPDFGRGLGLRLADLDGDGHLDLLTALVQNDYVRCYPGLGNGSLGAPTDLPALSNADLVRTGDFNDDGIPDIIAGGVSGFSVWLGTGGGAVGPRTDYLKACNDLDVGDLNSDGRTDVVTLQSAAGTIIVYLANPDGSLGSGTGYPLGSTTAYSVRIGRLNGDANPDVAVVRRTGLGLSMFLGSPSGVLGARTDFAGPPNFGGSVGQMRYLELGDLTGDGNNDLLIGSPTRIFTMTGNGSGGFAAPVEQPNQQSRMQGMVISDVDGDGKADVVAANSYAAGAFVYLGHGDGTLTQTAAYGGRGEVWQVAVGDLDEDGHPDLVVGSANRAMVSLELSGSPTLAVPHAPGSMPLALSRVWPSPSLGALHVAFTLPQRGAVALELIDVTGRRVMRSDLGTLEAGAHEQKLSAPAGTRAGVYWLRLAQANAAASARVVLVQ